MSYFKELVDIVGNSKPDTPEKQNAFLEVYKNHTNNELSSIFGVSSRTIRRWRQHCEENLGIKSPDALLDGHVIKGKSTLRDANGKVVMEWTKTDRKAEKTKEALKAFAEALKCDIKPVGRVELKNATAPNLLTQYTLTDYHLGMLAHKNVSGEDWDHVKAENVIIKWFSMAIEQAPNSDTAVLAQLGDFLHFDTEEPVTPASKHVLDASSRLFNLAKSATRILRLIIKMLLKKHKNVKIIMARANHDPVGAMWLSVMLAELYKNEPRIRVDTSETPFHAIEWGNVSLFYHHGDKIKPKQIGAFFAREYRDLYGRTKKSYVHVGHRHNEMQRNYDGIMPVMQHPTMIPPDAYAVYNGYGSDRGAITITYNKEYGEVGRNVITPAMLK